MLQVSLARLKQGHRTLPYPAQAPSLPDRFRGLPVIDATLFAKPEGMKIGEMKP